MSSVNSSQKLLTRNPFQMLANLICQPNPNRIVGVKSISLKFNNTINLFSLPIFTLTTLALELIQDDPQKLSLIIIGGLFAGLTLIFVVFCRSFPMIWKILSFIGIMALNPLLFYVGKSNILTSMAVTFMIPAFLYMMFQSQYLPVLAFLTQYIFFHLKLIAEYKAHTRTLSPPELSKFYDEQFMALEFVFIVNGSIVIASYFLSKLEPKVSIQKRLSKAVSDKDQRGSVGLGDAQDRFALKFSHELKNPLNAMLGNLEMATEENDTAKLRQLVKNSKVCGEILRQLISNIIDSGRVSNTGLEIHKKPTNLYELMEKVWGVSCEMITKKGLYGRLAIDKNVPAILELDKHRVMQILLNLTRNSVRFTSRGRVQISVSWLSQQSSVEDNCFEPLPFCKDEGIFEKDEMIETLSRPSANKASKQSFLHTLDFFKRQVSEINASALQVLGGSGVLKISFTDTGVGMDDQTLDSLFNTDVIFDENGEPTIRGLSMYITRQIVEKMDGEIRAYTKQGEGSSFIICLKTKIASENGRPSNEIKLLDQNGSHNQNPQQQMRAMVVDGNPYNLDLNAEYLRKCGAEVACVARTGEEAFDFYKSELAAKRPVHTIIYDIDEPVMEAKEICARIRDLENEQNYPSSYIVVVSGNCFESDIKECMDPDGKIQANHYLRKPTYLGEFKDIINQIQAEGLPDFGEPFKPTKVLMVDDDKFNTKLMGTYLTRNNRQFLEARNGQEAVNMYQEHQKEIALILTDIEMPILDGYESTRMIREIQAKKKWPKIPIYGVSGHMDQGFKDKCKEVGMNGTLPKPFDQGQINQVLDKSFAEYQ